jgi:hypothetical protein
MGLQVEIKHTADISNRELIKGIESLEEKRPEDYFWIKDRLSQMDTLSKEIWHFKTAAFKLAKRDLEVYQIQDLLKEFNKIQSDLIAMLKKKKNEEGKQFSIGRLINFDFSKIWQIDHKLKN